MRNRASLSLCILPRSLDVFAVGIGGVSVSGAFGRGYFQGGILKGHFSWGYSYPNRHIAQAGHKKHTATEC